MDKQLRGTGNTRQVARRRALTAQGINEDRINTRETTRGFFEDMVQLSCLKPGWRVLMLPDPSDRFGGFFVTQARVAESDINIRIEQTQHDPLAYM